MKLYCILITSIHIRHVRPFAQGKQLELIANFRRFQCKQSMLRKFVSKMFPRTDFIKTYQAVR